MLMLKHTISSSMDRQPNKMSELKKDKIRTQIEDSELIH
jgi:hypothetical protein